MLPHHSNLFINKSFITTNCNCARGRILKRPPFVKWGRFASQLKCPKTPPLNEGGGAPKTPPLNEGGGPSQTPPTVKRDRLKPRLKIHSNLRRGGGEVEVGCGSAVGGGRGGGGGGGGGGGSFQCGKDGQR
jgi:hypothetical protein